MYELCEDLAFLSDLKDGTILIASPTEHLGPYDDDHFIQIIGISLNIEADVKRDLFKLKLLGLSEGKTFKLPCPLRLNFDEKTIVDLLVSTQNGDIKVNDYKFDPRIRYTGTIKNIDECENAFRKTLTAGAIAAIVISCAALIAIIVVVIIVIKRKNSDNSGESNQTLQENIV